MRLDRAIEKFLEHGQLVHDWTPDTVRSYGTVLYRIADRHPAALVSEFEGRPGHDRLIADLGALWGRASAGTRANRISIIRSFFDWLESEYLLESNPARRIKRPPTRKPKIDRPTPAELQLIQSASSILDHERAPIVAMLGAGLRLSTVAASRWQHWNLTEGTVQAHVKGDHWLDLPLHPATVDALREVVRILEPEPGHYLYPRQRVRFDGPAHSARTVPDLFAPSSKKAIYNLVLRVSRRAIGRELHPHQLRHGFANSLDLDGLDVRTASFLMGHSRVDTTERYMDERRLRDARDRLTEIAHKRRQDSEQTDDDTLMALGTQESGWRESNPRTAPPTGNTRQADNTTASDGPETDPNGGHNVDPH